MTKQDVSSLRFCPMSERPDADVANYLRTRGLDDATIQWKFFDSDFNRGRERGFLMLLDNKVCGFLGLIPLSIGKAEECWDSYWSFDWSKNENTPKGAGRVLLEQASKFCVHHMGFGGNAITQNLYPKYASLTVPAGRVFRRRLRLGVYLDRIKWSMPWLPLVRSTTLRNLPVRRRSGGQSGYAETTIGVNESISPLLASETGANLRPLYDFEYVHWQIGRCPFLESATVCVPKASRPRAAALIWRQKNDRGAWRMKIWSEKGAHEELRYAIDGAVKTIYNEGGQSVSIIVSRLDTDFHSALESNGFYATKDQPKLYILATDAAPHPVEELEHLSYLDTDLGYRM